MGKTKKKFAIYRKNKHKNNRIKRLSISLSYTCVSNSQIYEFMNQWVDYIKEFNQEK